MTNIEIVVARFNEDLAWLRRVPKSIRFTVYDKGSASPAGIPLLNVGQEAHTYLHHIVSRYDDLADVTVFCQGKPFDHVPDLHRILRRLASGELRVADFLWLGFIVDRDDAHGTLFQRWSGNPGKHGLPMLEFWRALFHEPLPDEFVFYPSAHFVVTREQVHKRSLAFYQRALALSMDMPDAAHCFERCWNHVFGVNGVPPEYRQARQPLYLKPIKRLGIGRADVPAVGLRPDWIKTYLKFAPRGGTRPTT